MPLLSVPIMQETKQKTERAPAPNFNRISSTITETYHTPIYNESVQMFRDTNQTLMEADNTYGLQRESYNHGTDISRQTHSFHHTNALYEDIALPDAFLGDYYSQVICWRYRLRFIATICLYIQLC